MTSAIDAPAGSAFDTRAMLQVPVGAASPLWGFFAGAVTSGMAFWMMARLFLPRSLEGVFEVPPGAGPVAAPPSPSEPAAGTTYDAPSPPEAEPPVLLTPAAPESPESPVGGEAAPISPLAAAEPGLDVAENAAPSLPRAAGPRTRPAPPLKPTDA